MQADFCKGKTLLCITGWSFKGSGKAFRGDMDHAPIVMYPAGVMACHVAAVRQHNADVARMVVIQTVLTHL